VSGRPNRNAADKVFVAEKTVAKPGNDRRLWFQRTQGQWENLNLIATDFT
jgi:hypothetical protein